MTGPIHGTLYDEARDGARLRSVTNVVLDILRYRDEDDWIIIPELHCLVEAELGRHCREDTPRRMIGHIQKDVTCAWTIESRPCEAHPGTVEYKAKLRVGEPLPLFEGMT